MFRVAALMIVLALGVAPVAGIVCGLNCESQRSSTASRGPECHAHAASTQGAAINGVHVCDHDISPGPVVVQGQESLASSVATQAIAVLPSGTYDAVRLIAACFPTSPPGAGRLAASSHVIVLRI